MKYAPKEPYNRGGALMLKSAAPALAVLAALALLFAACQNQESDPLLSGTVSISGTPALGLPLRALTSLGGSGTISYQWKRLGSPAEEGAAIPDAASEHYTPAAADLGKYLAVSVSLEGYSGSITSAATAEVTADPVFTSVLDLSRWLASKPANTAESPYEAALAGFYIAGLHEGSDVRNDPLSGLFNAMSGGKYLSIDLSNLKGSDMSDTTASHIRYRANKNNLVSVILPSAVEAVPDYTFNGCGSLKTVSLPDSVTRIGQYAFSGCAALTAVKLPEAVAAIGRSAFNGCASLTEILSNPRDPPPLDGNEVFNGSSCPIKVPAGRADIYKSAAGWSAYADRIVPQ